MIGIPGVGKVADLMANGLTRSAIEHAYRKGQIVRVRRGIYCDRQLWDKSTANAADRHAIEVYAAWLAIGKRGWANGYSAVLLNDLPVPKGQPDTTELSAVFPARASAPMRACWYAPRAGSLMVNWWLRDTCRVRRRPEPRLMLLSPRIRRGIGDRRCRAAAATDSSQ